MSTLAACALSVQTQAPSPKVIAVFDARMGELYLGAYRVENGKLVVVLEDGLFRPDALPELDGDDWLIAGSGLVHEEALLARYGVPLHS